MKAAGPERQAGYTLSEVLVAVVILAVSVTAIVGAIGSSIFASHVHRDIVTSDAVVRDYAEQLMNATYVSCATPASYAAMTGLPAGFTVSITTVKYWDGTSTNPAVFGPACGTDHGVEQMTIVGRRINSAGAQTLQIVKRSL
jgi:prepilin-type N-terminal cleavage/methylation domain-containing protein